MRDDQATTLARVSEIERQTRLLAAFVNDLASLADDMSDAVEPDATPLPSPATLIPTVVISTTATP